MHDHDPSGRGKPSLDSATRSASLMLCLGALAGVLIWAKLRLVTDIPRSAYADPRENALPEDQDPESADPVASEEAADRDLPVQSEP